MTSLSRQKIAFAGIAAAYYLMFSGIRLIGAVRTSMILNLEPVFTIILSAIVLQETLENPQIEHDRRFLNRRSCSIYLF